LDRYDHPFHERSFGKKVAQDWGGNIVGKIRYEFELGTFDPAESFFDRIQDFWAQMIFIAQSIAG
jgi:hypothetical protein